jgi:hydrogenase nickel incorporation protein HypB
MCLECGCGKPGEVRIDGKSGREASSPLLGSPKGGEQGGGPGHGHGHASHRGHREEQEHEQGHTHGQEHEQAHEHGPGHTPQTLDVHAAILSKNDRLAERNRGFFKAKGLLVLNVVSAPGSGKTTLIQKTTQALGARLRTGVVVGDLATDNDAARLREAGVPVVQITTGTVCHLEAEMVARAVGQLELNALDLLIIENVGNLVCPAVYDLGEDLRVVLLSATEGEDKPLKYPPMFHSADVALLTKMDLAQAAEFDREKALTHLRRIAHHAIVFELSARTGEGMAAWCSFLEEKHKAGSQR